MLPFEDFNLLQIRQAVPSREHTNGVSARSVGGPLKRGPPGRIPGGLVGSVLLVLVNVLDAIVWEKDAYYGSLCPAMQSERTAATTERV